MKVFASRPFSASTKLNSTGTWIPAPMDTQYEPYSQKTRVKKI